MQNYKDKIEDQRCDYIRTTSITWGEGDETWDKTSRSG